MASTPRARTLGVRRVVLSPAPALVGPQTGINASLPSAPPTEAQISGIAAADFALLASLAGECRRALASPANGVIVPVKCISSKQGCARVGSRYVGHEADVECVAICRCSRLVSVSEAKTVTVFSLVPTQQGGELKLSGRDVQGGSSPGTCLLPTKERSKIRKSSDVED
jgi:hypothetical protein